MFLHDIKPKPTPAGTRVAASPAVSGHRPLALALALAACFAVAPLRAQPVAAQAIHGAATLSRSGANLTVTTQNGAGTNHSAINWQSFNVPGGSTTHFAQPTAASTSINRVLGNNPSAIFGTLSSNGRLVLVNPSGIAVGAGAVVDTAGFTASTLRMSDADALAGRMRFGQDGLGGGSLSVQGRVVARGGDVVLIAPQVDAGAQAVVQASGGDTLLVAGQKVELTGRGLEGIHLQLQAPADRALNLGALKGDSVGVFASQLRHSGLVQAQTATVQGGKVLLRGQVSADVSGSVTAQREGGARGGAIHVTADQTNLHPTAVLDASGAAGGGEVLVGGGWQGKGPLANAQNTIAQAGSVIRADATAQGDGGTVVLWSDGTTRTAARISARGGAQGGNGGRVETSGKTLVRRGVPDVSAPKGKAGTWLLDPDYILITNGVPETPALGDGSILAGDPGGVTEVFTHELENFSGHIMLEANHAILAGGEYSYDLYLGSDLTLRTLNTTEPPATPPAPFTNASRGIDLSRISVLTILDSEGVQRQVNIQAGTPGNATSGVSLKLNDIYTATSSLSGGMGGGAVTLRSAGNLWAGGIYTNHYGTVAGSGGNVTIEALYGHVRVGAINTTARQSYDSHIVGPNGRAGNITIEGKTVNLTGDIVADGYAHASLGSAPGNITIRSGLNCDASCNGTDTLWIGVAPMPPDSAELPKTYEGPSPIMISALSGHASSTGEPVDGGTIVLEAMAGNIGFEPDQYVQIHASGRENDISHSVLTSSKGGTVRVKALAGSIHGGSLNIDVSGGDAADGNGDGIPDGRRGGDGGTAELSAATGIALADSLVIRANGGNGGWIGSEPMGPYTDGPAPPSARAGEGGHGGSVTVSTTSGSLLAETYTIDLRAEGGEGGSVQSFLELSEGTLGAGGQGGSVTVKAPTLVFDSEGFLKIKARGGEGGNDENENLAAAPGGVGGVVDLEATGPSGRIEITGYHKVKVLGNDEAQPYSGTLHLRAGSGGVNVNSDALLEVGSLHLDSPGGQPNTLGDVHIVGSHEIRGVYGPVTNPSVSHGYSGGSGPASLTLESSAETLRLGGGNSQALTVAGDISITLLDSEGRETSGTMVIADTVQSQNGTISLYTNKLKLASGASHEKLVATNPDRGAVQIISERVIRFSPQPHSSDPDGAYEIILNSDEIARLDTPVLRVRNNVESAAYDESVVFGASAAAPAPYTTAGPAPAPVDRVMFNGPGVLSPGKTVSIHTSMKVAQTEPFSVDRMHITAGAVDLMLSNLFGPNTASGRGWFSAEAYGFGADLNYGEQAFVRLRNAAEGTLELSAQDTGPGGFNPENQRGVYAVSNLSGGEGGMVPLVQIAALSDDSLGVGTIEIGQAGIESGFIALQGKHIYNKGISGDTAQGGLLRTVTGDAANSRAAGDLSIALVASGNIGSVGPNGYINVHPAHEEGQTLLLASGGASPAFPNATVALYFPLSTLPLQTSNLAVLAAGAGAEVHIASAHAITVNSNFTPAAGVVALYAGQRSTPEPHDSGVLTVSDGFLVGGLAATGTVKLEGASVNIGAASVGAINTVQIEALGAGESSGNITLAPTALVSSGDKVALHAQGSILGNAHTDGLSTQISAPKVFLGARKSVYAHVDAAELVAGDAPENTTGTADTIDLVLTGTQPTTIRGVGNADGDIRISAPFATLVSVSGNIPADEGITEPEGGIVGKNVTMDVAGDLYVGRRIKATDNAGSGVSLTAGDVIKIGHLDNYKDKVHVTSETDIHLTAQSIYIRHTAGNPTGLLEVTNPDSPTVMVKAGPTGTLYATALSDETFEVNATNTGGVSTQAGGGMSITSPTILFVGGNGPNQFALATSPANNFNGTVPVFTPGTGLNAFAQSGAVRPVFAPLPSAGGGGGAAIPPAPPAPTPPPRPAPPPPAPTPPAPTPATPPPPAPAPAAPTPPAPPPPAPGPASAPAVDSIVEALRNDTSVTRAEVQAIVNEIDNNVTRFVALLIKEEAKQAEEKRKEDEKKETIAVTGSEQCKQ